VIASLLNLLDHGQADACFYEADGDVSYGMFRERVAQTASALAAAGVGAGDRVAMQLPKGPTGLAIYGATILAGAVLVPMNPGYTDDETKFILADAKPKLFINDEVAFRSDVARLSPDFEPVPRDPDELAAILYTSGTTGRPKGAMLTDGALVANALALRDVWQFTPDDCFVHALPLYHAHGLFITLNCVLASGCRMRFLGGFVAQDVIRALPGATVFSGVPTYYTRLLAEPGFDAEACASMRLLISGSAPMLPSTHDEIERRTGLRVHERYGTTETQVLTAHTLGDARPGTVGVPLPGYEVRVAGELGYVEARSEHAFTGYWGRTEQSPDDFTADGFFRTGDVGALDAAGHLVLSGRSKDLIISGGLNVYPVEVERVLDAIDGVEESAVVAAPDADFGEVVVAFVVAQPGVTLEPEALRAAARVSLAGYKAPKRITIVDALPRNAMGKVEKTKLRGSL
jgi:malonyl-CoA/methylmalonyl-CoA synthetase